MRASGCRTGNLNVQVEDAVFVSILVESGYHLVVGNILPGRAVEVDASFTAAPGASPGIQVEPLLQR